MQLHQDICSLCFELVKEKKPKISAAASWIFMLCIFILLHVMKKVFSRE